MALVEYNINDIFGFKELARIVGEALRDRMAATTMKKIAEAKAYEKMLEGAYIVPKQVEFDSKGNMTISPREVRQKNNIQKVVQAAAMDLNANPKQNEDKVDDDWGAFFFDNVQDVSNEEIQNIWAKILAGEIRRPGSYALRTLRVLKDLSKEEALSFRDLSPYIIDHCAVYLYSDNFRKNYTEGRLITLQDAGLIQYERKNVRAVGLQNFVIGGAKVTILNEENLVEDSLLLNLLTEAGKELSWLLPATVQKAYIEDFIHSLHRKNNNEETHFEINPV